MPGCQPLPGPWSRWTWRRYWKSRRHMRPLARRRRSWHRVSPAGDDGPPGFPLDLVPVRPDLAHGLSRSVLPVVVAIGFSRGHTMRGPAGIARFEKIRERTCPKAACRSFTARRRDERSPLGSACLGASPGPTARPSSPGRTSTSPWSCWRFRRGAQPASGVLVSTLYKALWSIERASLTEVPLWRTPVVALSRHVRVEP